MIFFNGRVELHAGDCRSVLKTLADNSVDSVCTDPPYHLQSITKRFAKVGRTDKTWSRSGPHQRTANGFMNQAWDGGDIAFQPELWAEVLRVLKPGGYIMAFSGCRTYHRMACAIEDAGFITHPMFAWIFGSGFPKAHSVSKQIDRAAGAQRNKIARVRCDGKLTGHAGGSFNNSSDVSLTDGPPITAAAREWDGWFYGTQSLKPSLEPIYFGQKPFSEKTGAANVLRWGTGAINVGACKVGPVVDNRRPKGAGENAFPHSDDSWRSHIDEGGSVSSRWPANLIHDGSEEVLACFPEDAGGAPGLRHNGEFKSVARGRDLPNVSQGFGDSGSAARFFASFPQEDEANVVGQCNPDIARRIVENAQPVEFPDNDNASFQQDDENTCLCGLCSLPFDAENDSALGCNANNAEPNLSTGSTQSGASVLCDVAALHALESAGSKHLLSDSANDAEPNLSQTHPPECGSVRENAQTSQFSKIVRNVRSAASLCDSCATAIARALVELKTYKSVGLLQFPDSISGHKEQILRRHLALYVEARQNTDIILTTENLKTLFGSVFHAIANTIGQSDEPELPDALKKSKRIYYTAKADQDSRLGSRHPTVKPLNLLQYLVRLVTPPGGTCLDLFAGTGTTGEACFREGFRSILIEREEEYIKDIERRMALVMEGPDTRAYASMKARNRPRDDGPLFGGSSSDDHDWGAMKRPSGSLWNGAHPYDPAKPGGCDERAPDLLDLKIALSKIAVDLGCDLEVRFTKPKDEAAE